MSQKPRPKFFCEHCGAEVRQRDKICPKCGKFFASVKCPSCGFAGDSSVFRDGCPSCGYAVYGVSNRQNGGSAAIKKREAADPLPIWMYVLSLVLLAALVALIVFLQ